MFSEDQQYVINDFTVNQNEELLMVFEEMQNFQIENDSIFPGMSLKIISQEDSTLLSVDDFYKNTGLLKEAILNFNFYISDQLPYDRYKVEIKIWDKRATAWMDAHYWVYVRQLQS